MSMPVKTFQKISTGNSIGDRMRGIRTQNQYTQSKAAESLGIADRTYNYYELNKRDVPVRVALQFCELFEIEIAWLLTGSWKPEPTDTRELIIASILAVNQACEAHDQQFSEEKKAQIVGYVFSQVVSKGTDAESEAQSILELIS